MTDWTSHLKGDPTEWLLEESNPSVRYLALRDLLGKGDDDPEVREAKRRIMEEGVVPKVLAKQEPGGHWGLPEHFYQNSKYKGTVWNLIVLAEMHADPSGRKDKERLRVRPALEPTPPFRGFLVQRHGQERWKPDRVQLPDRQHALRPGPPGIWER